MSALPLASVRLIKLGILFKPSLDRAERRTNRVNCAFTYLLTYIHVRTDCPMRQVCMKSAPRGMTDGTGSLLRSGNDTQKGSGFGGTPGMSRSHADVDACSLSYDDDIAARDSLSFAELRKAIGYTRSISVSALSCLTTSTSVHRSVARASS